MKNNTITSPIFLSDVIAGLTASPKYLSSKYFYDDEGSRIFQRIMEMPEYYLTDCEMEIFKTQKQEVLKSFAYSGEPFHLIELGAGDGIKTAVLLEYFVSQGVLFEYLPVDISGEAVKHLTQMMKRRIPELTIHGKVGDYFEMMDLLNRYDHHQKILMFLGSNIGNFNAEEADSLLKKLYNVMQAGDLLFTGFDLQKDAEIILQAYNDPHGYTADFNLNLLRRINRELGADFDTENFKHHELYNPENGRAESFLISKVKQQVFFPEIDQTFTFEKGEQIYMEMSQKYSLQMIESMAENTGFEVVRNFIDSRQYYVNSLWKPKQ